MALPFDATVKDLVRDYPADWLAQLGAPTTGPVRLLTPDLSTLTAFADLVFDLGGWLLHLDLQRGPDPVLPRRRADRGDLADRVSYEAPRAFPGRAPWLSFPKRR